MGKTITLEDLWRLQRIGAIAASPDGRRIACTVSKPSMEDNRSTTRLWLLDTEGSKPSELTLCGEKDGQPAFSPDGQRIAFVGQREQQGTKDASPQLYVIDSGGGEARRVSRFAPGVLAFRWFGSTRIVFAAWVWPEERGAAAQNRRHMAFGERKESGYATGEMQVRHWDQWLPQGRVVHLLLLDVSSGRISDLFEGTPYELPRDDPGLAHFDASTDGKRLAFVHDPAPQKAGGNRCELVECEWRRRRFGVIASHPAWDFSGPRYSPDGRLVAAVASEIGRRHTAFGQLACWPRDRAFEPADARRWTHDVQPPLQWEADGRALWFVAEERGRCHGWRHDLARGESSAEVRGGWVSSLAISGAGADVQVASVCESIRHPAQVHLLQRGQERRLESFNDALLARLELGRTEAIELRGAQGDALQLWLTYPPRFDPRRRHAALLVIHGGPYTASGDSFSLRWNPHLLAAQGHVVVQPNYHGSSGFGEDFRHSIMGRQGELEGQDLQATVDWLQRQPWLDRGRLHASGASYGGYLVAWLNGHWKSWPEGPIRSYVCHAGVFDRVATWSADSYTQRHRDLGATYWGDAAKVAAQSPHTFAAAMNTPTLVIHGAQDLRVPDHNGLAYYNTLKARGVDARLLWFPDEGHWVLKPRNSRQWHAEFAAWLARHDARAPGDRKPAAARSAGRKDRVNDRANDRGPARRKASGSPS